jgi:hypothetical protein
MITRDRPLQQADKIGAFVPTLLAAEKGGQLFF